LSGLIADMKRRFPGARIILFAIDANFEVARLVESLDEVVRLPASPLPRGARPRVALVPGGSRNILRDDPLRRWPLAHYRELASALLDQGWEVVLVGGPQDLWTLKGFEGLAVKNLIGQLSLVESIALFNSCDLLISHDTGPFHLAMLTSASVLGLFGPTDPRSRLPNLPRVRVIWGGEHLACRPCYDGKNYAPCSDNRCLKEVSPAQVLDVTAEMVSAARASQNGVVQFSQTSG
jgi:heptosyltransferase-2